MIELNEQIKKKLADAMELWRDEYLVGKPALLATGIYYNSVSLLTEKTEEVIKTFGD